MDDDAINLIRTHFCLTFITMIRNMDCLEYLKMLDSSIIDCVITDPPSKQ